MYIIIKETNRSYYVYKQATGIYVEREDEERKNSFFCFTDIIIGLNVYSKRGGGGGVYYLVVVYCSSRSARGLRCTRCTLAC